MQRRRRWKKLRVAVRTGARFKQSAKVASMKRGDQEEGGQGQRGQDDLVEPKTAHDMGRNELTGEGDVLPNTPLTA